MPRAASRDLIYFRHRHDSEVIELCVRWYLTYKLSYRDLAAMMAERNVAVTHTTHAGVRPGREPSRAPAVTRRPLPGHRVGTTGLHPWQHDRGMLHIHGRAVANCDRQVGLHVSSATGYDDGREDISAILFELRPQSPPAENAQAKCPEATCIEYQLCCYLELPLLVCASLSAPARPRPGRCRSRLCKRARAWTRRARQRFSKSR
jgi:hypothetical protein